MNDSVKVGNKDKETTETGSRQKTGQEYLQMPDWKIFSETVMPRVYQTVI